MPGRGKNLEVDLEALAPRRDRPQDRQPYPAGAVGFECRPKNGINVRGARMRGFARLAMVVCVVGAVLACTTGQSMRIINSGSGT